MAWFGHSGSQAPQLMHSSVIMKAIVFLLEDYRIIISQSSGFSIPSAVLVLLRGQSALRSTHRNGTFL
jgi:hypothetical protein